MNDNELLACFPIIRLDEMEGIRLMDRQDSKYLTDERTVRLLLHDALDAGYMVFEADGVRCFSYDTLYYDTPSLQLYLMHHNCRLTRQKIRTRIYVDADKAFVEVKQKNNHGRTAKQRMGIPVESFGKCVDLPTVTEWLANRSWFEASLLSPSVETLFRRITLVNASRTERVTIDQYIGFQNIRTSRSASLGQAAIVELKQDGRYESQMKDILLHRRVKRAHISKYCMGVTLTDSAIKSNHFRQKARMIAKLCHGEQTTIACQSLATIDQSQPTFSNLSKIV